MENKVKFSSRSNNNIIITKNYIACCESQKCLSVNSVCLIIYSFSYIINYAGVNSLTYIVWADITYDRSVHVTMNYNNNEPKNVIFVRCGKGKLLS